MKKLAVTIVFATVLAVVIMSCGGGGLKGTRWVGEYGVKDVPAFGYSFPKPQITFQRIIFDDKANKVSIQTSPENFFQTPGGLAVENREYEIKGKEVYIYLDDMAKVKDIIKKQPVYTDLYVQKLEIGQDVLKIGKVEFKKMKKDEADNLYQATLTEFQTKQDEFQKKAAEYNSKFK